MLALDEISKIGLGTYRMNINDNEHYKALKYAVHSGCNLIDTASNYENGDSEKLIGKFLQQQEREKVFVTTKGGYVQGNIHQDYEQLKNNNAITQETVSIGAHSKHCIHPDFLETQLNNSIERLQQSTIDGYLLHNTDYYLKRAGENTNKATYYQRIKKAFEYLEEQVIKGRIRYYGISSNTFPLSDEEDTATSLSSLLEIANEVSANNHFKLIQFPFNIIENGAAINYQNKGSLLSLAKKNNIITLANRPLNVHRGKEFIRLATYEDLTQNLNYDKNVAEYQNCIKILQNKLRESGSEDDINDLDVIQFLNQNWMHIGNHSAVDEVVYQHFLPIVNYLFDGDIFHPETDIKQNERDVIGSFINLIRMYSSKTMTEKALALRDELIQKDIIDPADTRPLSVIMCDQYLKTGIDHVLVGMRNPKYIDQLKELF